MMSKTKEQTQKNSTKKNGLKRVRRKHNANQLKSHGTKAEPRGNSTSMPPQGNSLHSSGDNEYAVQRLQYPCSHCDKIYWRKRSLKCHIKIHHMDQVDIGLETTFACDYCDKHFSSKSDLKRHTEIHTGVKRYCCETCGMQFSHSSHFTSHLRIHTGEKLTVVVTVERDFVQSLIWWNTWLFILGTYQCIEREFHSAGPKRLVRYATKSSPENITLPDIWMVCITTLGRHTRVLYIVMES